VFWVHASNAARFEQSYRDIADRVKIAGRGDPQANIFKLVQDWLCDCKQRWLLVLDNVDDARFLLDRLGANPKITSKPLREYLPHCERGSILVTTRNKEAALRLVEQRDIVSVEPMDEAQALALFKKKLGAQGDDSNVAELAATLEYMPLAIVQAAAYVSQRAPRHSVAKYLEEFRKSERKRSSLLTHDNGQLRRDWEAKNSIVVTWQISFEYVQQTRPSAADLLSLMSFFDRQGIAEALLQRRALQRGAQRSQKQPKHDVWESNEEDNASQSNAGDYQFEHVQFEDDIVALRNFCFVSVDTSGTSFEMHALVQLATRMWLKANSKLEQWKQVFISNLSAEFPTGEYENWAACQALFAHARSALGQPPEDESSLAEWASLLYRAAWYAEKMGNITDAATLAMNSMKARKKVLGQEHKDTLSSMAMVGSAYRLGGRWQDAEKLEVEVMETRKTKLGIDHPDTLTSMGNLASTYWNQGRWEDAEKLQVQVMETRKTKLGDGHADTLTSMGNLASIYRDQGRWDNAEKLQMQVMEMRKTKLEVDHPDTLTSMANVASIYSSQGRYKDAEQLGARVIEMLKTKLGADHHSTLTSMDNLASTFLKQGQWDEAEKLFVEVIEKRKTKLGVNHPSTLSSISNLSVTYSYQERWSDVEKLEVQVMETSRGKLGADDPITLTSMANLASAYCKQGRWEDAEKLEVEVMETRKTKLGIDHPDTLTSMGNLASTYRDRGQLDDAEELFVQVMETSKTKLGADHPDTLLSMSNLGSTYLIQGRWEDAEKLFVQVMETRKKKLGVDHPSTLASMNNMAFTRKAQGQDKAAVDLMRECVQRSKRILKAGHPNLVHSLAVLAAWEAD
jgi:tetratricopeptide (TPR) repeat protein